MAIGSTGLCREARCRGLTQEVANTLEWCGIPCKSVGWGFFVLAFATPRSWVRIPCGPPANSLRSDTYRLAPSRLYNVSTAVTGYRLIQEPNRSLKRSGTEVHVALCRREVGMARGHRRSIGCSGGECRSFKPAVGRKVAASPRVVVFSRRPQRGSLAREPDSMFTTAWLPS